ncbi:MAG: hypothetical protein MR291_00665 [Oscillospiraceae bacterium]|nr:hypothetical protein [Oscillospiraceae bacterium]
MTKQIKEYLEHLRLFLEGEHSCEEYTAEVERLRVRIGFFSHERIVHMFIMLAFAIFFLMTFFAALTIGNTGLYVLAALFLVLLVPYIRHYYFLENSVQKMYLIYNEIESLAGGSHER